MDAYALGRRLRKQAGQVPHVELPEEDFDRISGRLDALRAEQARMSQPPIEVDTQPSMLDTAGAHLQENWPYYAAGAGGLGLGAAIYHLMHRQKREQAQRHAQLPALAGK